MLLFQSWIVQGQNTLHCIPIEESRIIHEMAGKYLGSRDALLNRDERIIVLENDVKHQKKNYELLLKIAATNLQDQQAISTDYQKHSQSFANELSQYQKISKKQKRQNILLKGLLIVAGVVIAFQAIN